ncbi:unnamed protein product [Toxocara canis]|uniref:CW-type domain-containing protein n=1 Tax=Toxocara canis TaxID=6265 RepID=A0A183U2A9_TOXCA|nr:unnamed protein product [Toxocara canis]
MRSDASADVFAAPRSTNTNSRWLRWSAEMTDEDETAGKTPEECRDCGLWEVDPVYYSLSGNNKVIPHICQSHPVWSYHDEQQCSSKQYPVGHLYLQLAVGVGLLRLYKVFLILLFLILYHW